MQQQCECGLGVVARFEVEVGELVDVANVHLLPLNLILVEMLQLSSMVMWVSSVTH